MDRIDALRMKGQRLKADLHYATERAEACRCAWLRGHGTAARFESWQRKAAELGEAYFTLTDELCDALTEAGRGDEGLFGILPTIS